MGSCSLSMMQSNLKSLPTRVFYVFLVLHVLCWTFAASWARHTLPIDANEASIWARSLQWGYDRDPYFLAVCAKLALWLSRHAMWGMYFAAQCAIGVALWATWRLANNILPPFHAVVAILMLEFVQYYNIAAIDFDDNVLQVMLWSLTVLCFYHVCKSNRIVYWLLTGCCVGFLLMTRYYAVLLIAAMLIYLISDPERRRVFLQARLYMALLVVSIIVLPHVLWLAQHDWLTLHYVLDRSNEEPRWIDHLKYPFHFLWAQCLVFFPALILFMPLFFSQKSSPLLESGQFKVNRADLSFLLYIGLLPLVLTLLLSVVTGFTLRVLWGMSLLSLGGIFWVACCQVDITLRNFYRFVSFVVVMLFLFVSGYMISVKQFGADSSANFPAEKIAIAATHKWHDSFHSPLAFVVGNRRLAGNIAFFSPDRPMVYIDADARISTWIDENTVKKTGALFVWDTKDGMPLNWKARFPNLIVLAARDYYSLQDSSKKVITVGIAMLPAHPLQGGQSAACPPQ